MAKLFLALMSNFSQPQHRQQQLAGGLVKTVVVYGPYQEIPLCKSTSIKIVIENLE